jgi:hypothetical protein
MAQSEAAAGAGEAKHSAGPATIVVHSGRGQAPIELPIDPSGLSEEKLERRARLMVANSLQPQRDPTEVFFLEGTSARPIVATLLTADTVDQCMAALLGRELLVINDSAVFDALIPNNCREVVKEEEQSSSEVRGAGPLFRRVMQTIRAGGAGAICWAGKNVTFESIVIERDAPEAGSNPHASTRPLHFRATLRIKSRLITVESKSGAGPAAQ